MDRGWPKRKQCWLSSSQPRINRVEHPFAKIFGTLINEGCGPFQSLLTPVCQWCDPSGMAFNPGNGRIYLANFGMGKVSVVSDMTNNIVATIVVGNNPFGALYDPLNQKVYISDYTSAMLSKIDPATNTVIANLSAGNGPWNIALDTANGLLYITNLGSNTVTAISP